MPEDERPYEKCIRLGAERLSDVELLAILLRTGTHGENAIELARKILYHAGESGILGIHQFNIERLRQIRGIGKVKAIQISCISELAKGVPALSWLSYGQAFGIDDPIVLNLGVMVITFGLSIKITMASIIGVILSIIIYRFL